MKPSNELTKPEAVNNTEEEQKFVRRLADQMLSIIAGTDMAQAHTAISLMVAATIIGMSDDEQERAAIHSAFCKQVASLMTPEWVEFIKSCITRITLTVPVKQQ